MAQIYSPYSSALPFFAGAVPAGVPLWDQQRIQSYDVYEQFYWNHPESYKILIRGEEEQAIYLPDARTIIESTNRFLAVDFKYTIAAGGSPELELLLQQTFKRELFYTKFATQRRFGLIRGDAVWHITGDGDKEIGSRLSLHEVHPGQYFPFFDDAGRRIAVYLVDEVPDPKDATKKVSRRQAYRRSETGTGITTELALFELGKWNDFFLSAKDVKQLQVLRPVEDLPTDITSIPVYHIQNTYNSGWAFGSSTLRGVDTVLQAIQQGITDQALIIALGGLGVYVTDAGPPRDSGNNITKWDMGPGQITEIPAGSKLERVGQLGSISPSLDHINFIANKAQQGLGIPDIAAGAVDVAIAESGIALALKMAPILASNAEKEQSMLGVYDQMLYDFTHMWIPSYEQMQVAPEVDVVALVGEAMPKNRDAEIAEVILLHKENLITTEMAIGKLTDLGYKFPPGAEAKLLEQAASKTAATDPFATRANAELNGTGNGSSPAGASNNNGKPVNAN
jgi:hypothetical protein